MVYNESRHIESAIESIHTQSYGSKNIDFVIVDGGSTDGTLEILESCKGEIGRHFFRFQIYENEKRILAAGWNIAIKNSLGKYCVRIDGHSTISENYLKEGVKIMEDDPSIGAIGGWLIHLGDGIVGKVAKRFYASPLGAGGAAYRSKPPKVVESDTVVFPIYRVEQMKRAGLFNEQLKRNQDVDFHRRYLKLGWTLKTSPDMPIKYSVRSSALAFCKKAFSDGKWIPKTQGTKFRHWVPLFFLISFFLFVLVNLSLLWFYLGIYFLTLLIVNVPRFGWNISTFLHLSIFSLCYHFLYGFGTLVGLISVAKDKIKGSEFRQ